MGNPVSVTHIQISKADSKYQKLDSALHFLMIFTLQGVFVATADLFWALWKIAYTFSIGHLRPQTNEHKNPRQKFKISPPYCSCIWRVENGIVFYTLVSGVVSRYRWWPRDLYYQIKSPDLTKRRDRSRGRCRSREDRELVMAKLTGMPFCFSFEILN